MIKINFSQNNIGRQDILIIPIYQETTKISFLPKEVLEKLKIRIKNKDFQGKNGEIISELFKDQKIIFLGLGEKKKLTLELAKIAGAKSFDLLGQVQNKKIGLLIEKSLRLNIALKIIEGLLAKNYLDMRYKTGEELAEAEKKIFDELTIIGNTNVQFEKDIDKINKITEAIFFTRDLVSAPPIDMKPEDLAREAEKLAKEYSNLRVKCLNKKQIEKEGLRLLAAVNRGSFHEPRLIILELNPNKKGKPIVLIGKGITFDSGGYNLKPSGGFLEIMHTDMAGGATIMGTIKALALLKSKRRIIGLVPATENLISGEAYKPSDIIKSYSGKTVEIKNTDAEGRLILADAISYAEKNFNPEIIIDLATLTGACIIALGERYAGVFSNQPELIKKIQKASETSGDKVWPLPLDETFKEKTKSKVADLSNLAELGRFAGSSTAAAFLSYFIEETPWIHIDIAGPASQSKELEPWNPPSGATGFGVSLLIELIQKI